MQKVIPILLILIIVSSLISCSVDVTDPETSETYKEYATDDGFTTITPPPPPPPPGGGYTNP